MERGGWLAWSACVALWACGGGQRSSPLPPAVATTTTVVGDGGGSAGSADAAEVQLLATSKGAPGTEIDAYLARNQDGTPTVTLVTRGLRDHPQLVLSLLSPDKATFERVLAPALELMTNLTRAVPTQVRLEPWMSATVGASLFDRDELVGLAAVPAQAPAGVPVPAGAVSLLVLTRAETEVARRYGATRVAAMLGFQARFYPTIWWLDIDRPSTVTDADVAHTLLADQEWPRLSHTFVFQLDTAPVARPSGGGLTDGVADQVGRAELQMTPGAAKSLAAALPALPAGSAVFTLVSPSPDADGRAVWTPGVDRLQVITGPGLSRTITGSFIAFVVDPDDHGARMVEDGLLIILSAAERDRLVTALGRGAPYASAAPTGENAPWRLTWRR